MDDIKKPQNARYQYLVEGFRGTLLYSIYYKLIGLIHRGNIVSPKKRETETSLTSMMAT